MQKVKLNNGEIKTVTTRHGNMLIADKLATSFEEKQGTIVIDSKEEKVVYHRQTKRRK